MLINRYSNISLEYSPSAAIPKSASVTLSIRTDPSLGVAVQHTPLVLHLDVTNRLQTPTLTIQSLVSVVSFPSRKGGAFPAPPPPPFLPLEPTAVTVGGWSTYRRSVSVNTSTSGYTALVAKCVGSECIDHTGTTREFLSGVVVRPDPGGGGVGTAAGFPPSVAAPAGVFGSQGLGTAAQFSAAARLGVRSLRFGCIWCYTSVGSQGQSGFAWYQYDVLHSLIRQNNMTFLLDIGAYPPDWAANASVRGIPRADTIRNFSDFARSAITRYRDGVVGVSVDNEPDDSLVWRYKLPVAEAATVYVEHCGGPDRI